jgi:phosphate uptake regulator
MNHDTLTVERKVQLTGGSTYTVSLPKKWADRQGIEPGTPVRLHVRGDRLVMSRGEEPDDDSPGTTIDASTQEPATLGLSVAAAYIAGCEGLRVENVANGGKRRAVRRAIRRFVGLEVMTETEQSLSARTMLDVAELSPSQTLAQIERTALDMHHESIEALVSAEGDLGEQVAGQDDTVDRLFALVSRGFQRSLVDPAVTTEGDRSPFEYYMAARQLERIADHAEKMATLAGRLEDPPPGDIADEFETFGERSRSLVRRALAGLLDADDADNADLGDVVAGAETLRADLAGLDERLYDRGVSEGYLLGLVVDSLVRTTEYGLNIAEAGMQARHRAERH